MLPIFVVKKDKRREAFDAAKVRGGIMKACEKRPVSLGEIEKLVAELYYRYGIERWGDEYDIVLGGGSLNTRSPYNIYQGDVTYAQLQQILPFDNDITLGAISGRDLLNKFINSSKYATYYEIDPDTIDPNKTYYIISDTWTSGYSYNQITEIDRYDPYVYARDLVADFVKKGGWAD
jgi:hypothetical protein